MADTVSLDDAKAQLALLVERAASGEEIVISRNGIPLARLMPLPSRNTRRPAGALGIVTIDAAFDEPLPDEILDAFTPAGAVPPLRPSV
ncbi:MAG: type II toxin-antitoxin system prevent-host-death family antitoxin [Aliidongia sp.]